MKPTVAFWRKRKRQPQELHESDASRQDELALVDETDQLEWPDPKTVVDLEHIQTVAKTRQRTQVQSRGENKKYHLRLARAVSRKFAAATHATIEQLEKEIAAARKKLAERQYQKKQFERFRGRKSGKKRRSSKKPCTRWIQVLFGVVVLVMVVALLNGTFSVSAVMLDTTTWAGNVLKTITVGIGFFLLPGFGLSIPFHLLRSYPRWAYAYLGFLVCSGISCGFIFAVTWAHTFAVETGNQTMIDLTTIGMGSETELEEVKPWLFENANWLSLLFQILADNFFVGAAKSYLSYLSWNYHIFRDKAFQQDPEWLLLDQEVQESSQVLAGLEAEKRRTDEQLTDLTTEAEEFADAVCAYADGLFSQEVDRFDREEERIRTKEAELREKEAAWRRSQQELSDLFAQTPGINRKGDPNA